MEATEQQRDGDKESYECSYFHRPLTPVSKQQLEMADWKNDMLHCLQKKSWQDTKRKTNSHRIGQYESH